jgi:hypothetical protein
MAKGNKLGFGAGVVSTQTKRLSTRFPLFVRFLVLLVFLGFAGGNAKASGDSRNSRETSVGPGLPFAMADFDGDLLPDFASIQAGPNRSGSTDYRIQLRLSAAGRQSIGLVGPSGGLLIEARDVNGDHVLDLIVSTAWHRQPVAIFLNNGHGSFSRAELSAFPKAFIEFSENWSSTTEQTKVAVGAPQNFRHWTCLGQRIRPHVRSKANSISSLYPGFHFDSFLISNAGRAPPSRNFPLLS